VKIDKKELERITSSIKGTKLTFEDSKKELHGYSIEDDKGKITTAYDEKENIVIVSFDYGNGKQEAYSFTPESALAFTIMLHKIQPLKYREEEK